MAIKTNLFFCPIAFPIPFFFSGDFLAHPKDLIKGPRWLRGWRGNELQRCIRKKKIVGDRMFEEDYKNLNKNIKFLYKRLNRTGKRR